MVLSEFHDAHIFAERMFMKLSPSNIRGEEIEMLDAQKITTLTP